MKKKKDEITIRSSAAEYLTYVASVGNQQDSIEMRYEDENIWLTQKMMSALYDVDVRTINEHIQKIYEDGELTDERSRRGILEIKTTEILQSSQWEKWRGRIPDNYFCQILHYLAVTEWDFVVLRAQLKSQRAGVLLIETRDYIIEREDVEEDIQYLVDAERSFWEHVQSGRRPNLILPAI